MGRTICTTHYLFAFQARVSWLIDNLHFAEYQPSRFSNKRHRVEPDVDHVLTVTVEAPNRAGDVSFRQPFRRAAGRIAAGTDPDCGARARLAVQPRAVARGRCALR